MMTGMTEEMTDVVVATEEVAVAATGGAEMTEEVVAVEEEDNY
jgi:hypothetical protein